MSKALPIALGSTAVLIAAGLGILMWTVHSMPKPALLEGVKYSSAVYDRDGKLLRLSLNEDGTYRLPLKLRDLSPDLIKTTLEYEDRYFYEHPGVNPLAIVRASFQSLFGRSIGASTITMQVARMEQKLNTRSIRGKLEQIIWALRYEAFYSKDDILEAYFTLVPYGGNIEGATAASQVFFNKPADRLTPSEAASLSVIPQNPVKRHPITGEDYDKARLALGKTLLERGVYPDRLKSALLAPSAGEKVKHLPFEAPHFVRQVESENPGVQRIETTLSLELNNRLSSVLESTVKSLSAYGIQNGAIFVIDTRNNQVVADIGSADFFNDKIEGEVDGTRAVRSVGSTLKPFIYGLALDQGLIHSRSIVVDEERNWTGYQPKNEDGRFMGPMPATEALVKSRNIPALTLESRLNPDLYDLLQKAGANLPEPKAYYGLPIALGTAGLNMQKLTALYSALANSGNYQAPRMTLNGDVRESTPLLSEASAWIVRQMLYSSGLTVNAGHIPVKVALKTGTSNGYRDAWAAGLVGPYAMTVWLGNFNSRPNARLKGGEVAAPLFMDAAQTLVNAPHFTVTLAAQAAAEQMPESVSSVDVCPDTGDLAVDAEGLARCTDTVKAWFIPGKSPIATSPWMKKVMVDEKTGLRVCEPGTGVARYIETWPTHLISLAKAQGRNLSPMPDWVEGCRAAGEQRPQILQPAAGAVFFAGTASETEASVALKGSATRGIETLYWYDGASYLGASKPGDVLSAVLDIGRHHITLTDDSGNSSQVTVTVKRP